jgi:rubrerythrin
MYNGNQTRRAALQELKTEIGKAIPDEQDAQKMYAKMTTLALNAGMNSFATDIDLIRGQENKHEMIFRFRLNEVNSILK